MNKNKISETLKKIPKKIAENKWINSTQKLIERTIEYQKIVFTQTRVPEKFLPHKLLQKAQDLLEQKIEGEKIEVSLKTSTKWAKIISWSLVGGTSFGICWLALAKTEEIIIATGKLEPIDGVIEVKIPLRGVTSDILIKEGDLVKKGQLLIKLDTETSKAKQIALEKSKSINLSILDSLRKLNEEGAIAEVQYLQQQNKVAEIESQIMANKMTLKYQKIVSPADGLIFDLKPKKTGYVADPSIPLLKIVPNGKLRANIEIESRNIGFVTVGREADISIDSYPASDFGVIQGTVESLSSDALPPDPRFGKGYRFPAKIRLKSQYLQLKNKNKLPLQVGMSLTANIKLRKVSYLQLLLNTFQEKSDALRTM